jgi:hypothetical protein
MKFGGVNIYGHPNISCEDQHRLTTKKFFYPELKSNQQFYRLSAEESQSVFPHEGIVAFTRWTNSIS